MKEENTVGVSDLPQMFMISQEQIETYLRKKADNGVTQTATAKYRTPLLNLFLWLPEEKKITKERLQEWRKSIEDYGYSKSTVQNYVKIVNDYLRSCGYEEFCIQKPLRMNLSGMTFGYLTAITPTEKRRRRDIIWHCTCKCGNEAEVPATMLINGKTTSCGCLNVEILQHVNRYVEGTSLRQSMEERTMSDKAASGYTGVQLKRGKWVPYITYKQVKYTLGSYDKLEDAVKARANAKQAVMDDAARLYEEYADCYGELPTRPKPPEKIEAPEPTASDTMAKRSDNTSGCTGVSKKYGKWSASISWKGKRYPLGVYENLDDAVAVRKEAEKYLAEGTPEKLEQISTNRR